MVEVDYADKTIAMGVIFQDNLEFCKTLVESLLQTDLSPLSEIIVVDNFSRDGDYAEIFGGIENVHVRFIKNLKRMPLSFNRNQVFRTSVSDIIVFIDSDVKFIQKDFFKEVLHIFDEEDVAIAAPVIYDAAGRIQSFGLKRVMKLPYIFDFNFSVIPKSRINMVHGACFIVKREMLLRIGGFDEYMAPYNFDEMDLVIRAEIAGYKLFAFETLKIVHFGGGTTGRFQSSDRAFLFIRHALRSIRRNYGGMRKIAVTFIFSLAVVVRMLFDFKNYFLHFVLLRALIYQLTDINSSSLYIPQGQE